MQHLALLPAGALPSTTDDEPDCLLVLNTMLDSWSEVRARVDLISRGILAQVVTLAARGAQQALTGSGARTALENAAAAAAAGLAITAPSALATYATVTTSNAYNTGFDDAIQFNLAVRIAGIYKRPVPESVAAKAVETYNAIMPAIPAA